VVQQSTHKLKIEGLNPAPDTGREKIIKIFIFRGTIGIGLVYKNKHFRYIFPFLVYASGSTVVQHSTHKLKSEGLNPAPKRENK
jgi:hypothetical protein